MAMTTNEKDLISRLRAKMGDNPTRIIVTDDIGETLIIDGVSTVITSEEVGQQAQKVEEYIWTDEEHLAILNTAFVQLFKTTPDLETLSDYVTEVVVLKAQINLVYILATDATRYLKYNTRDVDVEKMSPTQFLALNKALINYLKELIASDSSSDPEVKSNEGFVHQSIIQRYDAVSDSVIDSRYNPPQESLAFVLSSVTTGVNIAIKYSFISNYREHFLLREDSLGTREVLKTFYSLQTEDYVDETAVDGETYTYELHVTNMNTQTVYTSSGITYAEP